MGRFPPTPITENDGFVPLRLLPHPPLTRNVARAPPRQRLPSVAVLTLAADALLAYFEVWGLLSISRG